MQNVQRVLRTKAEAKATYDRLSRWYDLLGKSSEGPLVAKGLRLLNVQSSKHVLEIGFGTGHGLVALAQAVGITGKVYGIDLSSGMLSTARTRIDQAGLSDRVTLSHGDALQLPYATGSFDAVFMSFTLELFDTPDIPIVLKESHRVLRRGGRLGVVSMSKACQSSVMVKLYEWAQRRFTSLIDCRPIYVQTAISMAGFQCDEVDTRSMWGLPVEVVIARKV